VDGGGDVSDCAFCTVRDEGLQELVLDEPDVFALLDHRPLFHGHVLVCPRDHVETLDDLPAAQLPTLFGAVQRVSRALRSPVVGAVGTFVANNNVVSQSVPHLHVHVVPRRPKDGLRGFFWPRTTYGGDDGIQQWRDRVRTAIAAV
jgi:histidine triad (HIT) family protein